MKLSLSNFKQYQVKNDEALRGGAMLCFTNDGPGSDFGLCFDSFGPDPSSVNYTDANGTDYLVGYDIEQLTLGNSTCYHIDVSCSILEP